MRIPKKEEGYVKHASAEAIRARLKAVRKHRNRLTGEVAWLNRLLAKRLGQIERNEWPPRK